MSAAAPASKVPCSSRVPLVMRPAVRREAAAPKAARACGPTSLATSGASALLISRRVSRRRGAAPAGKAMAACALTRVSPRRISRSSVRSCHCPASSVPPRRALSCSPSSVSGCGPTSSRRAACALSCALMRSSLAVSCAASPSSTRSCVALASLRPCPWALAARRVPARRRASQSKSTPPNSPPRVSGSSGHCGRYQRANAAAAASGMRCREPRAVSAREQHRRGAGARGAEIERADREAPAIRGARQLPVGAQPRQPQRRAGRRRRRPFQCIGMQQARHLLRGARGRSSPAGSGCRCRPAAGSARSARRPRARASRRKRAARPRSVRVPLRSSVRATSPVQSQREARTRAQAVRQQQLHVGAPVRAQAPQVRVPAGSTLTGGAAPGFEPGAACRPRCRCGRRASATAAARRHRRACSRAARRRTQACRRRGRPAGSRSMSGLTKRDAPGLEVAAAHHAPGVQRRR